MPRKKSEHITSITGGFFILCVQPVGCLAKKKTAVASSTAEAKYREMIKVLQRSIYVQTIGTSFEDRRPNVLTENDNMPAIKMIKSVEATKLSKFIDLRH